MRHAVGDSVAVTAKFNMADGVPKGLWLDESLRIAQLLEADGHLDALQLTGGSSLLNGMYFFRGDVPMAEFVASQPKLVGWGLRVYGPRIFPKYPFEEAFFLPMARQFREALSMPLILLGGINELDTIENALGEGFEFVAMARALLREPDLVNKFRDRHVRRGTLHPLQQVHAHHLHGHPLRHPGDSALIRAPARGATGITCSRGTTPFSLVLIHTTEHPSLLEGPHDHSIDGS